MQNDRIFIVAGLICLLAGLSIGLWFFTPMGGDLSLVPSHVHFNLLGWATLALYGLIHRAYPKLGESRLAKIQLLLALSGAFFLPLGFGLPRGSPVHIPLVALGAFCGYLGAIFFCRHVRPVTMRIRWEPKSSRRRKSLS